MTRDEAVRLAVLKDLLEPGLEPQDVEVVWFQSKAHATSSLAKTKLVWKDLTTGYRIVVEDAPGYVYLLFSAAKVGTASGKRRVAVVMR